LWNDVLVCALNLYINSSCSHFAQRIEVMKVNEETSVSRRKLLTYSLTGSAGVVLLGGCATLGLPRVSKAYAGYEEQASGKRRCHDCVHFQEPDGCTIVSGKINKDGVCHYFLPE
jgi:hypothetical protein